MENCDVHNFLLLPQVLYLRLLFRKLFMVGPYLLSLLDAGIALQGLITQVHVSVPVESDREDSQPSLIFEGRGAGVVLSN